jgi:hypothetical protein
MVDYLRQHGGLVMGMIRSHSHQVQFQGEPGVNVLYGLRSMQTILRRADRDHALTGFYGQFAQAMTVKAPPRSPAKWRQRLPLPPGWTATAASICESALPLGPGGVVDLTGRTGRFSVRYAIEMGG